MTFSEAEVKALKPGWWVAVGLCIAPSACGGDPEIWKPVGAGGNGGASEPAGTAGSTNDAAGAGGSTAGAGGAEATAGAAGAAGTGGAPPVPPPVEVCPVDDGQDTADLTLVGLGIPWNDADAGTGDAGTGDAGAGDAGAGDAGEAADGGAVLPPNVLLPGLVGWATQPGLGSTATLGGAMGRVVTARTRGELEAFAQSPEPLVIRICGTIRAPLVRVSSNKTLVGVGRGATLEGGLAIQGEPGAFVHDVVVKNLRVNAAVSTAEGVGILIDKAHHVWVDHAELFDAVAGLLHVGRGADFVTVSWTKFHFTPATPDLEHRFACMIGLSDADEALDTGHLKVTLHHNWWADFIRQRAPRVRFGDVHVFNNYYSSVGNDYSVWAALDSRVLLENNYFYGVKNPHQLQSEGLPASNSGELVSSGNVYDGATGSKQTTDTAFTPPYDYSLEAGLAVRDLVQQGAGVQQSAGAQ